MLWRLRILLCTRWCCDVRDALRLSGLHNTFSPAFFTPHTRKKSPSVRMGFFTLFDAWQFMAGVLPAPPGRCCATFKSAPGGFVLLRRALTDRPQIKQKGPVFRPGLSLLFDAWQFPTLAWGDPTLPSALRRFTSEFGMGSGGTTALQPPGKFCY